MATAIRAREGRGIMVKNARAPAVEEASCFCHLANVILIKFVNSCQFKDSIPLFQKFQNGSEHHSYCTTDAVERQRSRLGRELQKSGVCFRTQGCNSVTLVGESQCYS